MGARTERARRALHVTRVAQRSGIRHVLAEIGVRGKREATRESARSFRQALEELGTTYVKLGQLLSSRPDLMPDVYIEELSRLVDAVPPVPFAEIEAVIRADLGGDVFTTIDPEPLAAASIAQTHRALLKTGRDVVVKVRRPGIVEQVDLDLSVLRSTADFLAGHSETAQLLQVEALADELEVHLRQELDFVEEAHNTELIARLVEDYDRVFVPEVIRPHVTERVLVLEYVEGEKVEVAHDLAPDVARELARQFFGVYVFQVVVEGIYHGPDAGNILLTPDGRLALLDFGLLGRLDDDTRRGLSLPLLAIAQNRADDVADLILSLSLTGMSRISQGSRTTCGASCRASTGVRSPGFAPASRSPIFSASRCSTTSPCRRASRSSARPWRRPTRSRAFSTRSFDPIELMEEKALEVMVLEVERRLEPNQLFAYLYTQLDPISRLPRKVAHVLSELEQGSFKIGVEPTGLGELEANLRSMANRVGASLIVGSLLLASAIIVRVHRFEWLGIAGFCLAAVLGLYMLWKIIRTPGEL